MRKKFFYGTLLLFTTIYVISFIDRQIIAVLGVPIRDSLGLTNLQLGLLYGPVFSFVYAFSGIPMGRLADRYSRRKMIVSGLFIWSLMTVVSGFATSIAVLIGARMVVGVSQSMLSPAVHSYMADTFSAKHRATLFSIYASGIFLGIGLSYLAGGTIALHYDWRVALIAAGLPGLLLAPVAWYFIYEPPSASHQKSSFEQGFIADCKEILNKRTIRWHLLGFACLACTGYTILAFAGNIFSDVYNAPHYIPKFGWFMFGVAGTIILSGKLSDLLARKKPERRFWMPIVAAVGGIPFYMAGLFADDVHQAYLLIGSGVLISSSYNGVAAAIIQYLVKPDQRALTGGIYLFVISIAGFGVGPPVAGFLTDSVFRGIYAVSYAILTIVVCCGVIALFSFLKAISYYKDDLPGKETV
ncbi:MAG TPA: MFS transporter [Balneolaceae bacterium]|nr:MFS transporter [Balneolaceae bacterium]